MKTGQTFEFGPFRLRTGERVLTRNGSPVPLPPKDIETLIVLVECRGELVEKRDLLEKVWPGTFVEEGNLARHVSNLRRILSEGQNGDKFIQTVPRRGYRFVHKVCEILPEAEAQTLAEPTTRSLPTTNDSNPDTKRPALFLISALVLVALLLSAGYLEWLRPRLKRDAGAPRIMLAVLPVENLTGKPEEEFVCDGLTEELIAELGSLNPSRLGVIARTSSMTYKKTTKTAAQIGGELGVDYILESTIRGTDALSITFQLIRTSDQSQVWVHSYDRTARDSLALQREIGLEVAREIQVSLQPRGSQLALTPVTPEVRELYLKGRHNWNQRTKEGMDKAIEYFQQAVDRDPSYAPAHAGLASVYAVLYWYDSIQPQDIYPKAKLAAQRALEIDETLSEPHAVLGLISVSYEWDFSRASAEFTRAIELDPNNVTAHHWYAYALWFAGHEEQAISEMREALQLDPLSLPVNTDLGIFLYWAQRYDEAIQQLNKAIELDSHFVDAYHGLALAYAKRGDYSQAVNAAQMAVNLAPDDPLILAELGYVYAVSGKRVEAQAVISKLKQRVKYPQRLPYSLAVVYAGLEDKDQTCQWLEKTYAQRAPEILNLKSERIFDGLRTEPCIQSLLHRLNPAS